MEEGEKKKGKKRKIFFIILGVLVALYLIGAIFGEEETDKQTNTPTAKNYYIGDTMDYGGISLTVNDVQCQKNTNPDSEEYGLYLVAVSVTYKNNRTEEFVVKSRDTYIQTVDKGEKYQCDYFSGNKDLLDSLTKETVIAGATKTYIFAYYAAYPLDTKDYKICFDWGNKVSSNYYLSRNQG